MFDLGELARSLAGNDVVLSSFGPLTHSFRIAEGKLPAGGTLISRADVAGFMIGEAENPKHSRQIVGLAN